MSANNTRGDRSQSGDSAHTDTDIDTEAETEPGASRAAQADSAELVQISAPRALQALARGKVRERGLLPYSSNHSFLVVVHDGDLQLPAVYKPQRGESPLWDFEWGTLCKREAAAWTISEVLGWNLVPPTVLRTASRGLGSVQFYVDHEEEAHYFTVQSDARYAEQLRQLVLFDYITNNADRKSGHCLLGNDGRLWAIDHGLCFHVEYKLRTVIWEFSGEPIAPALLRDLARLSDLLERAQADQRSDAMDDDFTVDEGGFSDAAAARAYAQFFNENEGAAEPSEVKATDAERLDRVQEDRVQEDQSVLTQIAVQQDLVASLCGLLNPHEQSALAQRVRTLLRKGSYPTPLPQRRNYPWPSV